MNRNQNLKKLSKLKERYHELTYDTNVVKAQGELGKLCDLNAEFDDTFDRFFDQEVLRKKYNDWDFNNDRPLFSKSSIDLEKELDEQDLSKYLEFFEDYIEELKIELSALKGGV